MIVSRTRSFRRTLTVAGTLVAAVVAFGTPAQAHEAMLLDRTDVVPWTAPLIVDGTDPVATFGVLPRAGAVRSFQLRLQAGQQLVGRHRHARLPGHGADPEHPGNAHERRSPAELSGAAQVRRARRQRHLFDRDHRSGARPFHRRHR